MVAVNKKTAMPTMAALPLTISAVGVNFSSNLAPLYTPMTPSFNADGKYPCGSTTGTMEAPAMPATVNATKIGCVEMPVNTSALKVFNSANTKPICAHRPLINSAVGVHPDCLNKVSPYFSTNKASPKDVSVEPKISNAFVNSGMSISLTKPGIGDPPSAMSMMSSSSPKPSSPPDISWFICSALVTKVADLFEVVFVVGLKATMDAVNVVCAVVAENMIIFCGKGVGVKCASE